MTLKKIEVHPKLLSFAMKYLHLMHKKESEDNELVLKNVQNNYEAIKKKQNRLLDTHINGLIDESEYKNKKAELEKEKQELKSMMDNADYRQDKWIESVESSIDLATNLSNNFDKAPILKKRELLHRLGSNFVLENGEIAIELQKPYQIMKDEKENPEKYMVSLEPLEKIDTTGELVSLAKENPTWLGSKDSNPE